jgi:hypothetical protein
MRMLGDNQSALALIKNPVHYQRTKHIDIIHHAVRERVVRGEVMFEFCPTQDMHEDVPPRDCQFRCSIGCEV